MLEEKIYTVDVDTSSLTSDSTQLELMQLIASAFSEVFGLEFKVIQKQASGSNSIYSLMPLFDLNGNLFNDDIGFAFSSRTSSTSTITTTGEYINCYSYAPNNIISFGSEYTAYNRNGSTTAVGDSTIKFSTNNGIRFFIDTRFLSSKGFYSVAYLRGDYVDAIVSPWFIITKCKDMLENNEEHLGLIVFPKPSTTDTTIRTGVKDTDNSIVKYEYEARRMINNTKEDDIIMLKPIIVGRYIFDFYSYSACDNESIKSYSYASNMGIIHDTWKDGIIINGDHYLTTMRNNNSYDSTNILFKKPED